MHFSLLYCVIWTIFAWHFDFKPIQKTGPWLTQLWGATPEKNVLNFCAWESLAYFNSGNRSQIGYPSPPPPPWY